MEPNIEFGIEFIVKAKKSKAIKIDIVLTYPTPIKNEKGQIFRNYKDHEKIWTNDKTWTGYVLNKDYELVPGLWTYEVFYKDKLLYTKIFKLK
tara:strand:- start:9978 stop:10256 length:279 start_codon:yes stop_codon:yes gene_type:complete